MYGRLQGRTREDRSSFLVGASNTTKNNSKTQMQMHFFLPPPAALYIGEQQQQFPRLCMCVYVCVLYPYFIS